ncbi:MAG: ERF family protein, partial [Alphaproteobacteria bacterium]|nr:ERF family protein [Alphaproteobacteria bacterium]
IVELCKEYKLMTFVSFLAETAVLTAVNCENPEEQVTIYSPMKELELKGCNAIQALGGVETYQRRYLYMALFDIVENDMFDGTEQQENKKAATKSTSSLATAKEKLRSAMNAKVKQGMSTEEVINALNTFNSSKRFTEYSKEEIEKALKFLEVIK